MAKTTYQMMCDGEQEWQGIASDAEQAEYKCFYDEAPNAQSRYTLQKWGYAPKNPNARNGHAWVTVYENQNLAFC